MAAARSCSGPGQPLPTLTHESARGLGSRSWRACLPRRVQLPSPSPFRPISEVYCSPHLVLPSPCLGNPQLLLLWLGDFIHFPLLHLPLPFISVFPSLPPILLSLLLFITESHEKQLACCSPALHLHVLRCAFLPLPAPHTHRGEVQGGGQ